MTVIAIDGPEKTGKTHTITRVIDELKSHGIPAERVHWGLVDDFDAYVPMLKDHTAKRDKVWVYDRCWPSEFVYGKLLGRESHTMTNDPWLGAWCLDRAADANGMKVMLLPRDIFAVMEQRDATDQKVHPEHERDMYDLYAMDYEWDRITIGHDDYSQGMAAMMIATKMRSRMHKVSDPTRLCGPIDSPVLFVGETKSTRYIKGGFLPFSSRYTTMFGRDVGQYQSIQSRWSNITDLVPEDFDRVDAVVLCGKVAQDQYINFLSKEVRPRTRIMLSVPHPSYLYRYNTSQVREAKARALDEIHNMFKEL